MQHYVSDAIRSALQMSFKIASRTLPNATEPRFCCSLKPRKPVFEKQPTGLCLDRDGRKLRWRAA